MTLQEALASGQPFRRAGDTRYYHSFQGTILGDGLSSRGVGPEDIQATDWETQEAVFQVTEAQLLQMVQALQAKPDSSGAQLAAGVGVIAQPMASP